jgi:hypothetical protein
MTTPQEQSFSFSEVSSDPSSSSHQELVGAQDENVRISYFDAAIGKKVEKQISIETLSEDLRKKVETLISKFNAGNKSKKLFDVILAKLTQSTLKAATITKERTFPLAVDVRRCALQCPKDIEKYADETFFQEVVTTAALLDMKIEYIMSSVDPPQEEASTSSFIQGIFAEFRSSQGISHIQYAKDSPFANGRACARFELLLAFAKRHQLTNEIQNVPEDIRGSSNKLKAMIQRIIAQRYKENERESVHDLIRNFAEILIDHREFGVANKFGLNLNKFFTDWNTIAATSKRSSTKSIRGKNRKVINKTVSLTPTKPSQLKTVCPFEINSVKELWEFCWREEEILMREFNSTRVQDRDYPKIRKTFREIQTDMWNYKQKVLSQTKHRQVIPKDGKASLTEILNETQRVLSKIDNAKAWAAYADQERGFSVFPIGQFTYKGDTYTSFSGFLAETKDQFYPQSYILYRTYYEYVNTDSLNKSKTQIQNSKDGPKGSSL